MLKFEDVSEDIEETYHPSKETDTGPLTQGHDELNEGKVVRLAKFMSGYMVIPDGDFVAR
jgi:hypothetical protein